MWLQKIFSLAPAKWPVARSIRTAIGVGTPLAIGLISGQMLQKALALIARYLGSP